MGALHAAQPNMHHPVTPISHAIIQSEPTISPPGHTAAIPPSTFNGHLYEQTPIQLAFDGPDNFLNH